MRHLNALFRHGIGINGMAEEQSVDGVGQSRDNHQRNYEGIAIGDFGNEEDTRQRRVKHACHQATHTHKGKLGRIQLSDA